MMAKPLYDPACETLARHFLADCVLLESDRRALVAEFARELQLTAEDFCASTGVRLALRRAVTGKMRNPR